jgi:hypothetical protein
MIQHITKNDNKAYAFFDVLQKKITPSWYVRILLFFIPQRKHVTHDGIVYYKLFQNVVYITGVEKMERLLQDTANNPYETVDVTLDARPIGYKSDYLTPPDDN